MRVLWLLIGLFLLPIAAQAQQVNVYCLTGTSSTGGPSWQPASAANPCPVNATVSASIAVSALTSTNLSGTIATTNTFQSVQVLSGSRKGCTLQNNGTHEMYAFFGPIGSATEGSSINLAAGQAVSCAVGGLGVLTDQISITGTTGDAFFAAVQ